MVEAMPLFCKDMEKTNTHQAIRPLFFTGDSQGIARKYGYISLHGSDNYKKQLRYTLIGYYSTNGHH